MTEPLDSWFSLAVRMFHIKLSGVDPMLNHFLSIVSAGHRRPHRRVKKEQSSAEDGNSKRGPTDPDRRNSTRGENEKS